MARLHWLPLPDRRAEARELRAALGLNPIVAHVLLNRGVPTDDLEAFLQPTIGLCADPHQLAEIDRAADRLAAAMTAKEKVVIYGDYDADGCCAGAIMSRFLASHEVPYDYYVPDRFEEGYGVNAQAIVGILTRFKPKLIVTVDCGISSAAELETAVQLGTDVIVTDHHQVPERLPAVPAVNPHRPDSEYPFRDLCGATVAYKLCQVVAEKLGDDLAALEAELIELVAIGTVADVMPLMGENRYLVRQGLAALSETRSIGLRALMEVAKLGERGLTARDLGFGIGPRLNAAGRLEDAQMAYRLLITEDRSEAYELAETLERLNRERREIEARTTDEARAQLEGVSLHDTWGLVVAGQGWHEGVLGLVAGRLCREHHRPTLAIALSGDEAKGSGRSTKACDLHATLTGCSDLLTRFGGHPRAAGFSLESAKLEALRERFNAAVHERLTEDDLAPSVELECPLKAGAVTLELAEALATLAPYGEGNPEPVFEIRGLRISRFNATKDGTHLQLGFQPDGASQGTELKGFWPRKGQLAERLRLGMAVTAAAEIGIDTWRGNHQPQLMVRDLRLEGR